MHQMIAERIRYYRQIHGWSQTQLAEELNTTQCVISCTENAKIGSWIDSLEKLGLIADVLKVDLKTLIFGGGRLVKNYKEFPVSQTQSRQNAFRCDNLKITVKTETDEDIGFTSFCLTAKVGRLIVGKLNGLSISAYYILTDPFEICGLLDEESDIYHDECLAYIDRVLPLATVDIANVGECYGISDEEIEDILERMDCAQDEIIEDDYGPAAREYIATIKKMDHIDQEIAEKAESSWFYVEKHILFFDDIIVHPDCRQNGILTKMMDVLKVWYGEDFSGAAYIFPVKTDQDGTVIDDEDAAEADLERNRMIAEKLGWSLTDDFIPSAGCRNTYALKLPEYILKMAKLGEEFRKYVPHIENDE